MGPVCADLAGGRWRDSAPQSPAANDAIRIFRPRGRGLTMS